MHWELAITNPVLVSSAVSDLSLTEKKGGAYVSAVVTIFVVNHVLIASATKTKAIVVVTMPWGHSSPMPPLRYICNPAFPTTAYIPNFALYVGLGGIDEMAWARRCFPTPPTHFGAETEWC